MKQFGIVVYPEENMGPGHYPGLAARDGSFVVADQDRDEIAERQAHPIAVFFDHPADRDAELQALVKRWPNVMFCPVEIKQGFKTQPNPKATEFAFSNQGILPA